VVRQLYFVLENLGSDMLLLLLLLDVATGLRHFLLTASAGKRGEIEGRNVLPQIPAHTLE
jgi:hypothetical protein